MKPINEASLEYVKAVLESAAIDYTENGDECVYVTGLQFNFWIFAQPERSVIDMVTYEQLPEGVDEFAALRCVNALNQKFIMVQFSLSECGERLNGRYLLSCRAGLPPAALLRAAQMFSSVFGDAISESPLISVLSVTAASAAG
jgi:hypothetical protein